LAKKYGVDLDKRTRFAVCSRQQERRSHDAVSSRRRHEDRR
jgi:hypothetical protein